MMGRVYEEFFEILSNKKIAKDVYQLDLLGDTSQIQAAGQFVNLQIDGFYLRRPLSICDCSENHLRLIYKTFGKGTAELAKLLPPTKLSLLLPLGNGFDLSKSGSSPLLIGGGVGIPPLYLLAKKLLAEGKQVKLILGFNRKEELFYQKEFQDLACEVWVSTVDGSAGIKGFVTEAMAALDYSYFYTCGPMPMLKAVYQEAKSDGQFSLEARMGCGFGACMGCSFKTKDGFKRICKEGPVFYKEELPW